MRTRVVCAVLLAAALPAGASAQTLSMTESEVVARLNAENPRVLTARAGVEVARADGLAAGRWPNPRVTFNREAVAGITEKMLMAAQVLPVTGRRGLDVSAAEARVDAASSRADEEVRRLSADARLAFVDLWAAQMRERELGLGRDRLRQLADVLARREAAGEAAGFDRLRAEREVMEADADRSAASVDREQAQAVLLGFFSASPADAARLEAVRSQTPRADLPSIDELVARAEMSRGGMTALQRELASTAYAEQAADRRRIPEPEVVAGTKSSNVGVGDLGSIFSVHLTVPLFDRSAPERTAAQARGGQLRAETEAFRRTLRSQIAAWRAAVVERRAIADRYRELVTATAGEIERIAQVSYDAGERSILELLDAFRTSASARVRQSTLDAAVRTAEIELEFLSGWEIPE